MRWEKISKLGWVRVFLGGASIHFADVDSTTDHVAFIWLVCSILLSQTSKKKKPSLLLLAEFVWSWFDSLYLLKKAGYVEPSVLRPYRTQVSTVLSNKRAVKMKSRAIGQLLCKCKVFHILYMREVHLFFSDRIIFVFWNVGNASVYHLNNSKWIFNDRYYHESIRFIQVNILYQPQLECHVMLLQITSVVYGGRALPQVSDQGFGYQTICEMLWLLLLSFRKADDPGKP